MYLSSKMFRKAHPVHLHHHGSSVLGKVLTLHKDEYEPQDALRKWQTAYYCIILCWDELNRRVTPRINIRGRYQVRMNAGILPTISRHVSVNESCGLLEITEVNLGNLYRGKRTAKHTRTSYGHTSKTIRRTSKADQQGLHANTIPNKPFPKPLWAEEAPCSLTSLTAAAYRYGSPYFHCNDTYYRSRSDSSNHHLYRGCRIDRLRLHLFRGPDPSTGCPSPSYRRPGGTEWAGRAFPSPGRTW